MSDRLKLCTLSPQPALPSLPGWYLQPLPLPSPPSRPIPPLLLRTRCCRTVWAWCRCWCRRTCWSPSWRRRRRARRTRWCSNWTSLAGGGRGRERAGGRGWAGGWVGGGRQEVGGHARRVGRCWSMWPGPTVRSRVQDKPRYQAEGGGWGRGRTGGMWAVPLRALTAAGGAQEPR